MRFTPYKLINSIHYKSLSNEDNLLNTNILGLVKAKLKVDTFSLIVFSCIYEVNAPPFTCRERAYVPTAQCFHSTIFPQPYVPTAQCSHSPMFPQPYVPTVLRIFFSLTI